MGGAWPPLGEAKALGLTTDEEEGETEGEALGDLAGDEVESL